VKIDSFKNPPVEYRPVPFFSVNDDVEEERLLELVDEIYGQGWGGLFFHARTGLLTPYLGNRWFNLVKACVDRLRELGGRLWIYDENGWPSGQGGGQVTKLRARFRSKLLECRPSAEGRPPLGTLASKELEIDGRLGRYDFLVKVMPIGHLPDLLEPETVGAFLESTHDLYGVQVGEEFGEVIPGVFTDEPQYATHHSQACELAIPWTGRLPREFELDHGYRLTDHLESLFFDLGDFRGVRYDYYSTLTRLFVEAYTKRIHDWCERRSLAYTGHYEWEDSLIGQIHCIGSAMQHYEYMQQPGIDHLGRGIHNPWVEKQVASVSSQLGKERVLSESYGTGGQALDFHDRRWIGNFQYALGINFLCQHLVLYSLRGSRKRDYPPTLSPHQPWWRYNHIVADHFSRLSYVLSQGRRAVDVLFIHPIGAAWCEYAPTRPERVERMFEDFGTLTENMLGSQIDFEYGEEFILERHGRVEDGLLHVGESAYSVVVIPPMSSLKRSTFNLLNEFSMGGGEILLVGERPSRIEGSESGDLIDFTSALPLVENRPDVIRSAIRPLLHERIRLRRVSGVALEKVLVHTREVDGGMVHFLVNTDYERSITLDVEFASGSKVRELLPESGEVVSFSGSMIDLAAGEGRLFSIDLQIPSEREAEGRGGNVTEVQDLRPVWRVERSGPNQAVLDYGRWRTPGGQWSDPIPVWRIQEAVSSLDEGTEFEIQHEFQNRASGIIDLVVEEAERYDVYVNGRMIRGDPESWWLDHHFSRLSLEGCARVGDNRVVLRGRSAPDMSIEDSYIIGDFAVSVRDRTMVLEEEEEELRDISDLREQGYPFYAGTLRLQADLDLEPGGAKPFLEFDELGGVVAEFSLNGESLGKAVWREYRIPIDGRIRKGKNGLVIELTNSLRNLLGPRHWLADEFTGVNPLSFKDHHGWTDEYIGVPLGMKGLRLSWRT